MSAPSADEAPRADEPVRVVLVDDHPLFRSGLHATVERARGLAVAAEAASGEELLAVLGTLRCDVVLMDLRMPGLGGLEATRRVAAMPDAPAVLVLTMVEDDDAVVAALRAGAHGYLLKGADADEVVAAVRLVASGGVVMGPAVAARLLGHLAGPCAGPCAGPRVEPRPPFPELTERERRVLELLACGRSTAGIAAELALSTKTVRNYLSSTYAKLQVTDRYEAIARARSHGLGR